MRSDLQRGRGLATAPAKRIRIEIVLLEGGASSCGCWMCGMVLATASTSAYIAAKVSAQYTSPLSRGCG